MNNIVYSLVVLLSAWLFSYGSCNPPNPAKNSAPTNTIQDPDQAATPNYPIQGSIESLSSDPGWGEVVKNFEPKYFSLNKSALFRVVTEGHKPEEMVTHGARMEVGRFSVTEEVSSNIFKAGALPVQILSFISYMRVVNQCPIHLHQHLKWS